VGLVPVVDSMDLRPINIIGARKRAKNEWLNIYVVYHFK
jgi:hypothetical protein